MKIPKPNEREFETPPADTFTARCYRFIDLGTQKKDWQGTVSFAHKVMISWELSGEGSAMKDGRPFSMHQRYTWSMSEKSTLRKHLESWRGKKFVEEDFGSFDTKNLIGAPCMIGITHATKGDKVYANISSISRPLKGLDVPAMVNEPLYFSLAEFDQSAFDKLSQSLKEIIMISPEFVQLKKVTHEDHYAGEVPEQNEQDIPF